MVKNRKNSRYTDCVASKQVGVGVKAGRSRSQSVQNLQIIYICLNRRSNLTIFMYHMYHTN